MSAEADEQSRAEQHVERGRLDLDQRLVVEDRASANRRSSTITAVTSGMIGNAPEHRVGDAERDQHARHQDAGRGEDVEPSIDDEEERQRPEFEDELDDRIERLAPRRSGGFVSRRVLLVGAVMPPPCRCPAIASAKSRAAKGSRSSTPSPTPMKWTGSANLSAIATRMPPRAVPSSLVMTRPVTPAILPKISTWLSAFCPTVASSTSSTACGALGVDLAHHADDLVEFAHQFGPVLQAPGGVDEQRRRRRARGPAVSASKASPAASAPWSRSTSADAGALAPRSRNCSIAAARKVSPAASSDRLAFGRGTWRRACRWSWSCPSR